MRQISIELRSEAQNGEHYHAELDLPATDSELLDAFQQLRVFDGEAKYRCDVRDNPHHYQHFDDEQDLFALNMLARRMDRLTPGEIPIFRALVRIEQERTRESALPLQRLVDLSYSLDRCCIVHAENDTELGLYLYENGSLSDEENALVAAKMEDERLGEYLRLLGRLHREGNGGTFDEKMYIEFDGDAADVYVNRSYPQVAMVEYQGNTCVECVYPPAVEWVNEAQGSDSVVRFVELLCDFEENGQLPTYKALLEARDCVSVADALEAAKHINEHRLDTSYISPEVYAREALNALEMDAALGVEFEKYVNLWDLGEELMTARGHDVTSYGLLIRRDGQKLVQAPEIGGLQ